MSQVIGLACAPDLVVDDVGAGVDGLPVGGDKVGCRPGVVGGECRVRGSVLELQRLWWQEVEGVCRRWAAAGGRSASRGTRVYSTCRLGARFLLLDGLCEQGPNVLDL